RVTCAGIRNIQSGIRPPAPLPTFSRALLSLLTLLHRRRRLRVITIPRLCTSTSSIAGTSTNVSISGGSSSSSSSSSSSRSSSSGSADPLGYRVRIPGLPPSCHWSAPLPSTLCQPPPAANLCHLAPSPYTPPVSRTESARHVETRGNERTNSRIKSLG
ncbi:hypothetical protein ALC56_05237, partial [Trachymyrmex septentrionalis]